MDNSLKGLKCLPSFFRKPFMVQTNKQTIQVEAKPLVAVSSTIWFHTIAQECYKHWPLCTSTSFVQFTGAGSAGKWNEAIVPFQT